MLLIFSGEGETDFGKSQDSVGPLAKLTDKWIERRTKYSLIESEMFKIIPKSDLAVRAKGIKPRSTRGKKKKPETKYFYKNARGLAQLSKAIEEERSTRTITILFRDADTKASGGRGEWQAKWDSIIKGFEDESVQTGVPMVAKPISEAWILCALKYVYQNCSKLEAITGSKKSPYSFKNQLEDYLGQPVTRTLLNNKIDDGEIDFTYITDMSALNKFKGRADTVMDVLSLPSAW